MYRLGTFIGLSLIWCASARADNAPPKKITYDEHVVPILREHCFSCHNQDKKKAGLRLDNYTSLLQGGSSGAVVKPGDADGSALFLSVAHKQEPFMPPQASPIAKEKLESLRQWIQAGAPENAGSKVVVTANKPKFEMALRSADKGQTAGPPPMPEKRLRLDPVILSPRANALTAIAASPRAPLVAVAGQRQVLLYHAGTLDWLGVLPFPEGVAQVLKFSRNGSLLLAGGGRGGKTGRVVVWNVKTGERIFEIGEEHDSVLAADISADQSQIALGGPSKVVRVYSTKDGKQLYELKKHTDWIYALEFSPDGVLLATADRSGGVFVWESFTGREFHSLRGHTAAVTEVSWRPDANVLATASEDTTIRLWEMENGGQIKSWGAHGGGALSVRYATDGRIVSCGRDRVAKLWDGNGAQQRVFEALSDVALRVAVTHDAARVLAGDWSGQVRVWTAADGKTLGTLAANPAPLPEQFARASKQLDTLQAAAERSAKAATASQAQAQQAVVAHANAQKQIGESAALAKVATAALPRSRDEAAKATTALSAAQAHAAAQQVLAQALGEAAAKVKAAADQNKGNAAFAEPVKKSQQLAAQADADWKAADTARAHAQAAAKVAAEHLTLAQRLSADATAAAAAAPQQLAAQAAALKAAQAKAAADRSEAEKAAADLATLRGRIERLKNNLALAQAGK